MPRPRRHTPAGLCYHVLNRGNARQQVFHKAGDFATFLRLFEEAQSHCAMRIVAHCLMPNHFHLVKRHVAEPQTEAELASLRRCVSRGSPFGSEDWQGQTAGQLGLATTLRPRGRPRKPK